MKPSDTICVEPLPQCQPLIVATQHAELERFRQQLASYILASAGIPAVIFQDFSNRNET